MLKYIKSYITFIFLVLTGIIYAQTSTFYDANTKKIIKKADRYLSEPVPQYSDALELYLEAKQKGLNHPTLDYKIGICYLNTINKAKALRYLEASYRADKEISKEITFLLGVASHLNSQFERAIKYFEQYKATLSEDELQKKKIDRLISNIFTKERGTTLSTNVTVYNIQDIINKRIEECNNGITISEVPLDIFIRNIGQNINSPAGDYAPVINADESVMYITSRREGSSSNKQDPIDHEYYEDIYKLKGANGRWSQPENIGKPVNTRLHESAVALSADGQTLFIFKDDKAKITDNGDIFIATLEGNEWTEPKRMPSPINSDYSERAIAISPDEQKLYLISDRPGGYGKDDIYLLNKQADGTWSEPINLGPTVNTKYNERGVFAHPDGATLYFSSEGHNTMGGYDIFETKDSAGSWAPPTNMGHPVNTPDDDIYFVLNSGGTRGFYSSIKSQGVGEKDIYVIDFEKEQPKKFVTILTGFITDKQTGEPLQASIQLVDNTTYDIIGRFRSNSKTGKYLVSLPSGRNYGLTVRKEGYLFHSENFDIPAATEYQEIRKDIALSKIDIGSKIVLRNIFFDFDKATIKPESEPELLGLYNLMVDNSTLTVEISGHTDNKGNPAYNQRLSEARAQSVVKYLINLGISPSRLKSTGYGETRPIAPNENEDGSDNPEGRALNRRTEFEVLSK